MSKEHKNKRDAKKKPAMSPKEKKSRETRQKGYEGCSGALSGYYSSLLNSNQGLRGFVKLKIGTTSCWPRRGETPGSVSQSFQACPNQHKAQFNCLNPQPQPESD